MYLANRSDAIGFFLGFSLLIVGFSGVSEATVTDIEQNPMTGDLESVGLNKQGFVVHVTDSGPMGQSVSVTVSTAAGLDPRLSISEGGDTSIVWIDASGAVFYRKHDLVTRTWTPVLTVTGGAVAGTTPAVTAGGTKAWVAYEVEDDGDRVIEEAEIIDSAEPFLKATVDVVNGSPQDLDLRVFHEDGVVWIAWDDSATQIAWSEVESSGLWSIPGTITYDPLDKSAGYIAIQDIVLSP